jgi:hypothetical protein
MPPSPDRAAFKGGVVIKAGLRVWVDRTGIPKFEDIQARVRNGLARCRLLVAYYTRDYPASRACQWELTAAYLAGEREGDATRRVAVIRSGPSDGVDHLQPVALRSGAFVDELVERLLASRLQARMQLMLQLEARGRTTQDAERLRPARLRGRRGGVVFREGGRGHPGSPSTLSRSAMSTGFTR